MLNTILSRKYLALFVLSGILFFTFGCDEESTGPNNSDGRIIINNNPADLNGRVHISDDDTVVPITGSGDDGPDGVVGRVINPGHRASSSDEGSNVKLLLRAEVDPPEHNGQLLRATHVAIESGFAYVTYNVEGSASMGGVEVFDVNNITNPRIISQALFNGTDISAIAISNQRVYLAEATTDDGFDTPAALEEIILEGEELTENSNRVDLASYVATGVAVVGGKIYITSGTSDVDEGGLTILNQETLEEISFDEFDDARDVGYNQQSIVVMQGTPGRLRVYNRGNGELTQSYEPGGATIPESKSTIDVQSDYVYMAAGDEGMKVVDLSDGSIIYELDAVVLENMDPDLTPTNAVALNQDMVLMANGEAGLYIATIGEEEIEMLGFMNFASTSANYVKSEDNIIFVASGSGGLKILEAIYYDPDNGSYLTLGQWGVRGRPEYLTEEPLDISDGLMTTIEDVFRERTDVTNTRADFFENDNVRNTILTEDAQVFVTFAHETAGWRNALGFYTYPSDEPPESLDDVENMTIIFPNVSYHNGGGDLYRSDRVNISQNVGEFPAGTSIGYFLISQGWDGRRPTRVTNGLYRNYTDLVLNGEVEDDIAQQHVLAWDEENEVFVLAFDDTRRDSWLCDKDFNEAIMLITSDPPGAIATDGVPTLSE
jgi:hypothetical protein